MYPSDRAIRRIAVTGILAVLGLLFFAGLVKAEDQKLFGLGPVSGSSIATIQNSPPMALIHQNGEVTINWAEVERKATEPPDRFGTERAIAQLMLAIRDGTWKPAQ